MSICQRIQITIPSLGQVGPGLGIILCRRRHSLFLNFLDRLLISGEEGTFAYFLSIQDLDSDSGQGALRDAHQLLQRVDELIASVPANVS